MVSQRVYRTTQEISYHRLTEPIFPTLARSSVIRHRVSRLSVLADKRCCVCYCAGLHVPIWPEPWCEHPPLALYDCDLSCYVGGRHLRILCHCRADRRCFVVAWLVRRHFFVIHPSLCPFLVYQFSFAFSRRQLAFVESIASTRNVVQHRGIHTHNVLRTKVHRYSIL
jgi:hypothetical protein